MMVTTAALDSLLIHSSGLGFIGAWPFPVPFAGYRNAAFPAFSFLFSCWAVFLPTTAARVPCCYSSCSCCCLPLAVFAAAEAAV